MYKFCIKRLFDIIFSSFLLIILSPIYLIVSILIAVKLGRPVLFKQQRPGQNEKIFTMIKFRTMTNGQDLDGNFLPDSERLTKFGKLLRSTSLDEIPELLNILKGDMSFVGPRPLLVQYLPLYTEEQKKRHIVRPGLTGLAQVSGRNELSWDEKFNFDVEYVNNYSLKLDLVILIKTFSTVMSRKGITSENESTTEIFSGK